MDRTAQRALAERFLALPLEKQRIFHSRLLQEGIELSSLPIPHDARRSEGPLSHAQERLWFLWKLDGDSAAYNIASALRIDGSLAVSRVRSSLEALVARHPALRTRFVDDGERVHQHVEPELALPFECFDLREHVDREERAREIARTVASRPFDLESGPLLRMALLALAPEQHVLVLVIHHIVADGWSLNVLMREFAQSYLALARGMSPSFPELPVSYLDCASFQRAVLDAGEGERRLALVRPLLGDQPLTLELPLDHPRPRELSGRGGVVTLELAPALLAQLASFARARSSTLFATILATFHLLLHRYSGQRELLVGVPVANRERPELQGLVGLFVNTLVVRSELRATLSFDAFFAQVEASLRAVQAQQELPFEQLVDALAPSRSLDRNPVFQALYNHQSRASGAFRALSDLTVSELSWGEGAAQCDLSLDTEEDDAGVVRGRLTYARELFDQATVERLAGHFVELLWAVTRAPERRLGELAPIARAEQRALAETWQGVEAEPPFRAVHVQISERAQAHPNAIALLSADEASSYSYAELDAQSLRIAQHLRAAGVGPDALVAVCMTRSPAMIVAMLAVMRAGGAFVPIDPDYPALRASEMLHAASPRLILTERVLSSRFASHAAPTLCCEELLACAPMLADDSVAATHPLQLAYVIFTSGSTGKPKGVAMTHGSLAMHCRAVAERYRMTSADRALHFASIGFDASIEQWIVPLLAGARLIVRGPELWSSEQAAALIRRHAVSWFEMPPLYLTEVATHCVEHGERLALRACSVGGEALSRESYAIIRRAIGEAPLVNGYGPTEAAITPLTWTAEAEDSFASAYAPIGSVVGTRTAYVLDADLNLVPTGVTGELYLGLGGLARCYYGQPTETALRFLPDPFLGGRMYRTGDLVRRRADAQLEYVGRVDHQLKIRGFRVELGEIEARLLAQPEVREAVVVAHERDATKQLVAYVAVDAVDAAKLARLLAERLAAQLPAYMVPSQIVCLTALPRSASGKIDRQALPAPSFASRSFVAPEDERERLMAELFSALLGVAEVGALDNFFELGGDSILSLQLVSRAKRVGLTITPRDVFQYQTLRALAQAASREPRAITHEALPNEPFPLTPIQRDFFAQPIVQRQHYNQALLLEVRGALEPARLERALARVVAHHDALRLRFCAATDGQIEQRYAAQAESGLWLRACNELTELEQLCEQAQRSLELTAGPLLRAVYATLPEHGARLLLVVHHLVIDGVSWRVLLEDLNDAYAQSSSASEAALPAKTASFASWSRALGQLARSETLLSELPYWKAQHQGPSELLPTRDGRPALSPRPNVAETNCETLKLSVATTQALLRRAPAAYRTHVHELLLTALAHALCATSGRTSALIELEGHGREDVGSELDVSRTVGWFTSLFPLCLPVHEELGASIVALKETLRNVPRRGLGYGVLALLAPAQVRSELAALPRPCVTFNYLGQFAEPAGDALLAPAKEGVGALRDAHTPIGNALEINAQVYADELTLTFHYRSAVYDARTIRELAATFGRKLEAVVAHCIAPGAGMLTPADVPLAALSQAALERLCTRYGRVADVYPLTPLQQGMLFHSLLAPAAQTYVSQLDLRVTDLELSRFVAAFEAALARHPILRTCFAVDVAEQPLQVVLERARLPVEERDLSQRTVSADELRALCLAEQQRPLALDEAPLMRLLVLRLDARRHHLIWTHHHLLLDGWSSSRLLGEVLQAYAGVEVATPRSGFHEYLRHCAAQSKAESEALFKRLLGQLEQTALLADGRFVESVHAIHRVVLEPASSARLKQFARSERVTLNTVVQAAYGLMLQRYTGRSAAVFGATVAGRPAAIADADAWMGMFINTLPVLVQARAQQSVGDFLREVQSTMAALRDHEHVSLSEIQRWLGAPGRALFDALLVFENYPVAEALSQHSGALQFSDVRHSERTEYPLTLSVALGETLRCEFAHSGALEATWVARFALDFERLLHAFMDAPERPLASLPSISPEERSKLAEFGRSQGFGRPLLPVHLAIAEHAQHTPEREALVCDARRLSYRELAQRMHRVAAALMAQGIGREDVVGICMERSAETFVALLGVLATGAAFAPLDPAYPRDRLRAIATRANMAAIIVDDGSLHASFDRRCLSFAALERTSHLHEPLAQVRPDQLAYVIHTSGSTGAPKGVAVSHGAIASHCAALAERYELGERDVALTFAPFIFDASIEQWMAPWMVGARVVARGDTMWTPEQTARAIVAERISWIHLTPSYCAELVHWLEQRDAQLPVRICSIGGEALSREGLRALAARAVDARLFNAYGPTEAVVTPLVWRAPEAATCDTPYAPLGRPIARRTARVLDKNLEPTARGVVGELYLAGDTLARGYHAQPALTAERFLPDEAGGRLYRTGDLARYREDGTLEFLGREDGQVKLRGFRIELGDIENALLAEAGVAEASALLSEGDGGARLLAFVATGGALVGDDLRRALARKLPAYMVPAHVMVLSELPRAPTGKVDRRALRALEQPRRAYTAPQGELELALSTLVAELLGSHDPIGREDDFFERGGDSLLAMRLAARVKERFGVELSVRTVFEAPVLRQLAQRLAEAQSGEQAERDILTAIQEVSDLSEQALAALLCEAEATEAE